MFPVEFLDIGFCLKSRKKWENLGQIWVRFGAKTGSWGGVPKSQILNPGNPIYNVFVFSGVLRNSWTPRIPTIPNRNIHLLEGADLMGPVDFRPGIWGPGAGFQEIPGFQGKIWL